MREHRELQIAIGDATVSALLTEVAKCQACFVFAHGAGVGMRHGFMAAVAHGLGERGIATLRFQFPYMERGSKRPDSPRVAQAAVRAAVEKAGDLLPGQPLIAGGKSYGGRMTSLAQAEAPLAQVSGLAFFGFPLHPPGNPSVQRAEHLSRVKVPMLFLQGTRDELADLAHLKPAVTKLGANVRLSLFEDADHSFHVPVRSGKTDAQVLGAALDEMAQWIHTILA